MTNRLPDSVARARDFAVKAHGDQKYGDQPYSVHLDDLMFVAGYGEDMELRQVGFLHDVVEDTGITSTNLLFEGFDTDVVNAALFCSGEEGHNRKTRKLLAERPPRRRGRR